MLCGMPFFARFGLYWVMPCLFKEAFASWWSGGRTRSAVVWKVVPLCIMWCIWRERNDRCFEDSSMSSEELLHFFLFTLFTWTESWLALWVFNFADFLSFSSPPSPLLYTPCVLRVAPLCAFDIFY